MLPRALVAILLSGIALLFWGFIYWSLLPFPMQIIRPLPGEAAVAIPKLKQAIPETGAYMWPIPEGTDEQAVADWTKRSQRGPLLMFMYRKEGGTPMSARMFAMGFAHFVLMSAIAAWLMSSVQSALPTFRCRVFFGLALGVFASAMIDLGEPIWFHHPWDYHLLHAGFHIGNGLIMGLILGAIINPIVAAID